MDRIARLLSTSTRASRILEIGASHTPVAPKADGWQTHVVDHDDRAGLVRKYTQQDLDVSRIEEVDTVWGSHPLDRAIPAALHGQFDTIIASHVLEHLPNPVGFLVAAQTLLRPDGSIALALPDRRYCFDCLKPPTATGDLLEAYYLERTRHAPRAIWNWYAYTVSADGVPAWAPRPVETLRFMNAFDGAADALQRHVAPQPGAYEDCHAWYVTPASVALILLELAELGIVDWRIDDVHVPGDYEFFVFLRRGATPIGDPEAFNARRLVALRTMLEETRLQLDDLLGPPAPPPAAPDPVPEPKRPSGWRGLAARAMTRLGVS
jgi:predicted SAM-dependent methyltransferase